jgi:hypothetical protein
MISILPSSRFTSIAVGLSAMLACSGQEQPPAGAPVPDRLEDSVATEPTTQTTTGGSATDSFPWLTVDGAARTVTLDFEVTAKPGAASALINGYRAGEARIIVPLGWTVKWNWQSADTSARHSLVVMVQREKFPLEGGRASFSNAMTRMVTEGIAAGQTDQSTFIAEEAGWYWILCGVPGHAIDGEWLELRVDPEATTPSVRVRNSE